MAERSLWTFRIKDEDGNLITNLPKATKRVVNLGLNKAGEASFVYDLKELYDLALKVGGYSIKSLLGLGRHTLECVRNDEVMFAGQLLNLDQIMDATQRLVEVKALGWFWLLGERHAGLASDREFSDVDAGEIAWTLINETQSLTYGDFGITEGDIEASINRTITYSRKNLKEAIEELSGTENGFDFEIDVNKIFNVYYPMKGSDRTASVIYRFPGNIEQIRELNDATELVNYAYALGKGWGDQELSTAKQNADSQSSLKRRERIYSYKDVENAAVLGDLAQQKIDEGKSVLSTYKMKVYGNDSTPSLEDFNVGDIIEVRLTDDRWSLTQQFRVFEEFIKIGDNDQEDITLIVGLI